MDVSAHAFLQPRVLEIRWHWSAERAEGINSIRAHPAEPLILTAGLDGKTQLWAFSPEALHVSPDVDTVGTPSVVKHVATLQHKAEGSINCAVWSPQGNIIATANDDGPILLWRKSADKSESDGWTQFRSLTGHTEDVQDIAFSPCGKYLVSCSLMGAVLLHDCTTGGLCTAGETFTQAHDLKCQGVVFDPLGQYFVSFGADKVMLSFSVAHNPAGVVKVSHTTTTSRTDPLFKGEAASSFFRRGAASPDGTLLATPCAWNKAAPAEFRNCTFIFMRNNFTKPYAALSPKGDSSVLGVSFCPKLFPVGPASAEDRALSKAWGPSEYSMLLAMWTAEHVYIYTTDCGARIGALQELHYDKITDVSWSSCGRYIFVASLDGYISVTGMPASMKPLPEATTADTATPTADEQPSDSVLHNARRALAEARASAAANEAKMMAPAQTTCNIIAPIRKKKKVDPNATAATPPPIMEIATEEALEGLF